MTVIFKRVRFTFKPTLTDLNNYEWMADFNRYVCSKVLFRSVQCSAEIQFGFQSHSICRFVTLQVECRQE